MFQAVVTGGDKVKVYMTSTIMKVLCLAGPAESLNNRIVFILSDGKRRIVGDHADVSFDPKTCTIVFTFDRWIEWSDKIKDLGEVEMTISEGPFRWAVTGIEKRPDGKFKVDVAGGPPFVVGEIIPERSINFNGASINTHVYNIQPREEPVFKGNFMDGRFYPEYGHRSKRFQNWSNRSLAELAETRKRDICDRHAHAGPRPGPGSCAHPGCHMRVGEYTMYCEEAGCSGGDACPVGGKHEACFRHGLLCTMIHPERIIPTLD